MRFSLYALQFGKELLEVKSKAEQKQFSRDICFPLPRKYETHTKIIFFMIISIILGFLHREIPMKCCFWHNKGAPPHEVASVRKRSLLLPY